MTPITMGPRLSVTGGCNAVERSSPHRQRQDVPRLLHMFLLSSATGPLQKDQRDKGGRGSCSGMSVR